MKTTTAAKYIIMSRCPALAGKAREFGAGYRKLALVKVDAEVLAALGQDEPAMISERSKGVIEIAECQSVYMGRGVRSEGAQYLAHLKTKMEELNATL